jgi:hypothetical protein
MRLAGQMTCMGEKKNPYAVWWENLKEGDHFEKLG